MSSKKDESEGMNSPVAAADSTSDDTSSNEDGDASGKCPHSKLTPLCVGSCSKLRKLFRVPENKDIAYEFDSRVGLNGSQVHCTFPCLLDSENKRFYVWLGDITIDKLTKSTFLNIADFAENKGA
jgi:hypothetical protein